MEGAQIMKKRILALVLAAVMVPLISLTAEAAVTQNDAVKWLYAQENREECDIDGNGKWCVDLATAYMNYCYLKGRDKTSDPWKLNNPYTTYNANQYDNQFSGNPNWNVFSRTSSTVPQPGDIFVSERDTTGLGVGHVGVVLEAYGSTRAKIIQMSAGTNPTIISVTWGSDPSFYAEHFIRYNYFAEPTPTYASFDTNFYADGYSVENLEGIGTIQVYVDGKLQTYNEESSYTDFSQNVLVGKSYEVKVNITNPDYRYAGTDGATGGALTGTTLDGGTKVSIVICKDSGKTRQVPDGDYMIVSAEKPEFYLDIYGTKIPADSGANVQMCGPLAGDPSKYDALTLEYDNDGYYTISQTGSKEAGSRISLDLYGASKKQTANIRVYSDNGTDAQKWALVPQGDGYIIQ